MMKYCLLIPLFALWVSCAEQPTKTTQTDMEGKANSASASTNLPADSPIVPLSAALLEPGRIDTVNLGRVTKGEVVTHRITLRNVDTKAMVVVSAETTCGCTAVTIPKPPIQPGQEGELSFELRSATLDGAQNKTITVKTSLSPKPYRIVVLAEVE